MAHQTTFINTTPHTERTSYADKQQMLYERAVRELASLKTDNAQNTGPQIEKLFRLYEEAEMRRNEILRCKSWWKN